MRVLIVGAGAVGQVYGAALHRAGWTVHYLVKPAHLAKWPDGFTLHTLTLFRAVEPFRWAPAGLWTEPDAVEVDLTLWTVPTPVLHTPWLPRFLEAQGDVPAVLLQPGLDELARVRALRPGMRLTQGLIALIAYAPPLPGATGGPRDGTAVWVPFGLRCPLAGPDAGALARALSAGGLPASEARDLRSASAFGSAANSALVASLEAVGWRFDEVPLSATSEAIGQALAVTEAALGMRRPLALRAAGPTALGLLRWAARRRVLPLDLETYLRVHFVKVGAQTRQHLDELVATGDAEGVPVDALRHLREALAAGQP